MNKKHLAILEVSQKQAYIFSSNKLADNVNNSNVIAWIMSKEFITETVNDKTKFDPESNLVYEGGGHTILQFEDQDTAKEVIGQVTRRIIDTYPAIEVFASVMEYQDSNDPGKNIYNLTAKLEKKKAMRQASFRQGTFGIEKIDSNTLDAIPKMTGSVTDAALPESYRQEKLPKGYSFAYKFDNLGGSENDSNFIAVVHIDGNGMGKRVEEFSELHKDWDEYCSSMRTFSEGIADNYSEAYEEMLQKIADAIASPDGRLYDALSLKSDGKHRFYFPVRRIISEGDDICFVSEGRIGLEAAATFIECLNKKTNKADQKGYTACAGVALVHKNYPFYRAYELAEELCSNAKKFGASLSEGDNGASVSAIDWHIEYGEIRDSLTETRKEYITADDNNLELRPYIIDAPEPVLTSEKYRQFGNFRKMMKKLNREDFYGSGVLKELRGELKRGVSSTDYYLRFHKLTDIGRNCFYDIYQDVNYEGTEVGSGKQSESVIFVTTQDGKKRSVLFDAIEMMDTYIRLED